MKQINIAICGVGTVGGSALQILQQQADALQTRSNLQIKVTHIAWRSPKNNLNTNDISVTTDTLSLATADNIHIVVETIGGVGIAKQLVVAAIKAGKHIVTSNKQLLAEHGDEIFALARNYNVIVAFEAAVAGGIPIIKAMREGLVANNISNVAGIINGTGNFILTKMRDEQANFADAVKEAQDLGYAEADPSFDINGNDAAYKLAILSRLAFGFGDCIENIYMQGVGIVTTADIEYAGRLGYSIKHLGIAKRVHDKYQLGVYPALVSKSELLANVDGVLNSVMVQNNYLGSYVATGAGAGGYATASAIVADIVQSARIIANHAYSEISEQHVPAATLFKESILDITEADYNYYVRIALSDITQIHVLIEVLNSEGVIVTDEILSGNELVFITKVLQESKINKIVDTLSNLDTVSTILTLRVANFS